MSHYTVTVCLKPDSATFTNEQVEDAVTEALAPFDENKSVDPYREYEDGIAEDHWSVKHLREEGLIPAGAPVSWPVLIDAYNKKYHPSVPPALEHNTIDPLSLDLDTSNDALFYDQEKDQAYSVSTYSPKSKWDWWSIGGRWQRSILAKTGAPSEFLVFGRSGAFGDNGNPYVTEELGYYCDGGKLEYLDLEGMRNERAKSELRMYDRWQEIVELHGKPSSWDSFRTLAQAEVYTIDIARELYNSQPAIVAAKEGEDPVMGFFAPCPVETFGMSREKFEEIARANAVAGFALLTAEGEWVEKGEMGWFGVATDTVDSRAAYREVANKYIDSLPPSAWIVQVDCHI